jgi:DNA-binding beta-propeller fold protein YncE
MSAPQQCPPAQVEAMRHSRFLGSQPLLPTEHGQVLGLAADDRFVYATYHRNDTADRHHSPAPGELVVLDQTLLADPGADPVVARVEVGYQPRSVALNPRTGKVYVLNWGQQGDHPYSVFVIRRTGSSFAVTARIPLGGGIVDLAVNPRTNRVYVSNWVQVVPGGGTPVNGKIHVIDGAADAELPDRAVSVLRPLSIAFDESADMLYAALAHNAEPTVDAVAAISCGADGTTHTVQKVVDLPVKSQPFTVAVLAAGGLHRLYVGTIGSTPTGQVPPNLTRFELDGTFRSRAVGTAFGGPVGLAVDRSAEQVYVTTNAGFQVFDAVGETISKPAQVGASPQSVAVDAAGRVHVGDGVDGTLNTVLTVLTTGPVGEHWAETGGAGGLGQPVTGYRLLPGGDPRAGYQVFERGAVFASTDYGAVVLSRELTAAWEGLADRKLTTGTMQDLLGLPVEPAGAGSTVATFQRGLLFRPRPGVRAAVGGFTVVGDIYNCYVRPGNSAGLGRPVEDQQQRPDGGLRQRFEHGEICWRNDIGAFAVYGGIHESFWKLHNFDTPQLDLDQYARTFGMSLEAVYNPQATFDAARRMFENGDRPVLSFTRFIKFKGHTVLPIKFLGGEGRAHELPPGSTHWGEIWIADSRPEWEREGSPDSDGKYRVIIGTDNTFEYDDRYAGGAWLGDRMFAEPWHLLNRVPTLPGADPFLEGAKGFLALLTGAGADGGDVAVQQVTDGAGRTLFEPGLGRAPRYWSDLRFDPAARIPDLAPIPISAGDAESVGPRPLLFFGRGQDATHTYQVTGAGGTYRFGLRAPALGAVVTSRGGPVADHITASRLGTADRSVAFTVPVGGTAKDVSMVLDGLPRSGRGKQFLLDVRVAPEQRVAARLRDGGRELLVENSAGVTSCRVRVRPAPGTAPTAARQVPLAAGKVTRIRPADWRPGQVGSARLRVEVRDTVDSPPVSCFEV